MYTTLSALLEASISSHLSSFSKLPYVLDLDRNGKILGPHYRFHLEELETTGELVGRTVANISATIVLADTIQSSKNSDEEILNVSNSLSDKLLGLFEFLAQSKKSLGARLITLASISEPQIIQKQIYRSMSLTINIRV